MKAYQEYLHDVEHVKADTVSLTARWLPSVQCFVATCLRLIQAFKYYSTNLENLYRCSATFEPSRSGTTSSCTLQMHRARLTTTRMSLLLAAARLPALVATVVAIIPTCRRTPSRSCGAQWKSYNAALRIPVIIAAWRFSVSTTSRRKLCAHAMRKVRECLRSTFGRHQSLRAKVLA